MIFTPTVKVLTVLLRGKEQMLVVLHFWLLSGSAGTSASELAGRPTFLATVTTTWLGLAWATKRGLTRVLRHFSGRNNCGYCFQLAASPSQLVVSTDSCRVGCKGSTSEIVSLGET